MAIAIALQTLLGAVFLRAACALYNKLTGGRKSPNSVPEPLLGKAMGITFVTTVVNVIVLLVIGHLLEDGNAAARPTSGRSFLIEGLLPLPVSLLVMTCMNADQLPTTITRGFLVTLCYLLVVLMVIVVLAVIFGGLFWSSPSCASVQHDGRRSIGLYEVEKRGRSYSVRDDGKRARLLTS
jgi:hypothetical protein